MPLELHPYGYGYIVLLLGWLTRPRLRFDPRPYHSILLENRDNVQQIHEKWHLWLCLCIGHELGAIPQFHFSLRLQSPLNFNTNVNNLTSEPRTTESSFFQFPVFLTKLPKPRARQIQRQWQCNGKAAKSCSR